VPSEPCVPGGAQIPATDQGRLVRAAGQAIDADLDYVILAAPHNHDGYFGVFRDYPADCEGLVVAKGWHLDPETQGMMIGAGPELSVKRRAESMSRRNAIVARVPGVAAFLAVSFAEPARAECLGSCLDGMVAAMASIAVYAVIAVILLVMLIRTKWRRAGLWSLAAVLVLALGVPLVSQVWQMAKVWSMERFEVVGTPPDLATRTPLVIAADGACDSGACGALLWGRFGRGVYVVPATALAKLDLSRPIPLAELPLERWEDDEATGMERRRELRPEERLKAAEDIDYLIISGLRYSRIEPGALEAAIRQNPDVSGLTEAARVQVLMAPLDRADRALALSALRPDLLDLSLIDWALAIPLAPMNYLPAANQTTGADVAAQALCPGSDHPVDPHCLDLLTR
jgi:hypothetical protein